jgi:excisionase family DNA binding protein
MAVKLVKDSTLPAALPTQLVGYPEVAELLKMTRRSVERLVAAGQFPKPMRIGKRAVRFRLADVEAYIKGL